VKSDAFTAWDYAIKRIRQSVPAFAFDANGCKVLQTAIKSDQTPRVLAANLAKGLKGLVYKAVNSPHANHVIQVIVQVLPAESHGFVADELKSFGFQMSQHRYGCRIMQRLMERSTEFDVHPATGDLVHEVIQQANNLSDHGFGHHVVQKILEIGRSEDKRQVACALATHTKSSETSQSQLNSRSYVVQSVLQHCEDDDKEKLAMHLFNQPETLVSMAQDKRGCLVIQALFQTSAANSQAAKHSLLQLQLNLPGFQILTECQIDNASKADEDTNAGNSANNTDVDMAVRAPGGGMCSVSHLPHRPPPGLSLPNLTYANEMCGVNTL
jgi:hypothetical protein